MKHLLVWLTNTKAWSYLLLKILPYLRWSVYYTSFRGNQYSAGFAVLKPGDCLLSKDRKKVTSLLVGGAFTHASMCISNDPNEYQIAEMVHTGFNKTWFFDVCKESDHVVIIRCKDWDAEYTKKVIEKCKSFEGTPYDVSFEMGVKALACSELVWASDFERRLKVDLSDLVGLGRQYVSPTDLFEADNVEVIFDSDNII